MAVDINLGFSDVTYTRPDEFEGATGWKWISRPDETWMTICYDWKHHHQPWLTKLFPNGGKTAIMAGGCCGLYPALLTTMFDTIYTFEPDPIHFHCLVNNCQFANVIKIQAALGNKHGMVDIYGCPIDNTGMTRVIEKPVGDSIPMMKIDDFPFQNLDLIMLDTEGCEFSVLCGAHHTLTHSSPKLILELGDVQAGERENYDRCIALLAQYKYTQITQIGLLDFLIEKE